MQINFSQTLSFFNFLQLCIQQPDMVITDVKNIVILDPNQGIETEVYLQVNDDQRQLPLKPNSIAINKIVLGKTENGVVLGMERQQGDLPKVIFQNIAIALIGTPGTREVIKWGRFAHCKGEYAGVAFSATKAFDLYTEEGTHLQFTGNDFTDQAKSNKLNAQRWEMVVQQDGKIYLDTFSNGKVYRALVKKGNQQADISFDQVHMALPQNDTIKTMISIPNGNQQPKLLVVGNEATYYDGQIFAQQAKASGFDATTGNFAMVSKDGYSVYQIGDTSPSLVGKQDVISRDVTPLFGTSDPRILLNQQTALLVNVVEQISMSSTLPTRLVQG